MAKTKRLNKKTNVSWSRLIAIRGIALLRQLLWPSRCKICAALAERWNKTPYWKDTPLRFLICPQCQKKLVSPASYFCKRCAAALPSPTESGVCGKCSDKDWFFQTARPLHSYYGLARILVTTLKRRRSPSLAYAAAKLYYVHRRNEIQEFNPECVVGVPMYWVKKRFKRGGVNAPARIAKALAILLEIPDYTRLLKRKKTRESQTTVAREERAVNIRGAFSLRLPPDVDAPFKGKRVLLVDDAFTTGATVNEVARVLVEAGAESVYVAVLTRAGIRANAKHPSPFNSTPP